MSQKLLKNNLTVWDMEFVVNEKEKEEYISYYNVESILSLKSNPLMLNKSKTQMDIIEKLVFDISKFHLEQTNNDILSNNIHISFSFKTTNLQAQDKILHTIFENEDLTHKQIPKLSDMTILVNLNDSDISTILTNVDEETYKFKNFHDENQNLCIVFPRQMRNIVFDGKYFHGAANLFSSSNNIYEEQRMLEINIWKCDNPINLQVYSSDKYKDYTYNSNDEFIKIFKNSKKIKKISIDPINDKIINYDFLCDIFYKNDITQLSKLSEYAKKNEIIDELYFLHKDKQNSQKSLQRFNFDLNKIKNWNEHIHVRSNFLSNENIYYIKEKYKVCNAEQNEQTEQNELDPELLEHVLQNVAGKVCIELTDTYKLDKTYKIDIAKIIMSNKMTTSYNNTIIGSIFLTSALLKHKDMNNDIEIKKGTIVFQNNFYENLSDNNNLLLEFLIDITTI